MSGIYRTESRTRVSGYERGRERENGLTGIDHKDLVLTARASGYPIEVSEGSRGHVEGREGELGNHVWEEREVVMVWGSLRGGKRVE